MGHRARTQRSKMYAESKRIATFGHLRWSTVQTPGFELTLHIRVFYSGWRVRHSAVDMAPSSTETNRPSKGFGHEAHSRGGCAGGAPRFGTGSCVRRNHHHGNNQLRF